MPVWGHDGQEDTRPEEEESRAGFMESAQAQTVRFNSYEDPENQPENPADPKDFYWITLRSLRGEKESVTRSRS